LHHARTRRLAASLAVVALALAACGGDDDDAAETTTTTEATTTTIDIAAFAAQDDALAAWLMENGDVHQPKLVHCANLATAFTGIELKTVELESAERALLTYDILGPDGPLVEGSQGAALKIDGEWKIAETAFLSLYDAAKDGCTGPVPPE
jgi:hypothetical protein